MTTIHTAPLPVTRSSKPVIKMMVWVGLLVGTLDILSACLQAWMVNGISAIRLLQFIASGFFGKEAFSGGTTMAVYGLLFHYFIAYSFTAFFFLIYPFLVKIMSKNIIITAVLFGIFMYVVTNFIVMPLSKIPTIAFHFNKALTATAILIVAIGLPLSYFAKKCYYPQSKESGR